MSNRLKEVEVVMKSEALLIGNRNLSEEKQGILRELLFRMDAVKTAEDKKYVLMNAPKEKLDEIVSVLPGMKSPTVMPLAQEGWCSVHTVLDEKCFWEIIGKLKALGRKAFWCCRLRNDNLKPRGCVKVYKRFLYVTTLGANYAK